MNKILIALIYYINTYPFNKITCRELPNEFSIISFNYSLYYYINLLLNEFICIDDVSGIMCSTFIIINKLIIQGIKIPFCKQHKLMVESLKRGNKVLTAGGILGVVTKAIDGSETVSLEISSGVTVELARQMISEVRGEEKIKSAENKTKPKSKK